MAPKGMPTPMSSVMSPVDSSTVLYETTLTAGPQLPLFATPGYDTLQSECTCSTTTTITKTHTRMSFVTETLPVEYAHVVDSLRQYTHHSGYERVLQAGSRFTTLQTRMALPTCSAMLVIPSMSVGGDDEGTEHTTTLSITDVVPGTLKHLPSLTSGVDIIPCSTESGLSPPRHLDSEQHNNSKVREVKAMGVVPGTLKPFLGTSTPSLSFRSTIFTPELSSSASSSTLDFPSFCPTRFPHTIYAHAMMSATTHGHQSTKSAPMASAFSFPSHRTSSAVRSLSTTSHASPSPTTSSAHVSTSAPDRPTTSSRTSFYPRPSPPTFLYPDPIVPSRHTPTTALSPHMPLELPDFSAGMKVVLAMAITLAGLWTILIYFVNFPPAFLGKARLVRRNKDVEGWTGGKDRKRSGEVESNGGKKRGDTSGRKTYLPVLLGGKQKKVKPVDKPSKYARTPSNSSTGAAEAGVSMSTATTPWLQKQLPRYRVNGTTRQNGEQGIEMKKQRHRQRSAGSLPRPTNSTPDGRPPVAPLAETTTEQQSHITANTPGPALHHLQLPATSVANTPISPVNPFLPPTLTRRSSSEWLREHSQFFTPSPCNPRISPAPSSAIYSTASNAEELEAGVATTASSPSPGLQYLGSRKEGGGGNKHRRNESWLDMVDGIVTKTVDKVAKWTEGGKGDEGLLLPVANGDERA